MPLRWRQNGLVSSPGSCSRNRPRRQFPTVKAIKLQAEDTGNPFEKGKLSEALKFYQEANKLINNPKLRSLEKNLEQELEKRKKISGFF